MSSRRSWRPSRRRTRSPSAGAGLGAEVIHHGAETGETEAQARAVADQAGLTFISPYNDEQVIAGQGTVALELLDQLGGGPLDAVYVAVGGGGLASGIGATLRTLSPNIRLVGVSPRNDAAMAASVAADRVVSPPTRPTLSDGTSGSLEDDAITLQLCAELVEDWVLVEEDQIRQALRTFIDTPAPAHRRRRGCPSRSRAPAGPRARRPDRGGHLLRRQHQRRPLV